MPNENVHCTEVTELPKIVDNGVNNNYGEWKMKSYHKLREWDLLKYIEGPDSVPPAIPTLIQPTEYHGLDENNVMATVRVPGNEIEYQNAIANARPWLIGNKTALVRIVAALPSHQLHLVQNVKYAKQAWENLCNVYQSRNSLHAATIKGQLMTHQCTSEMNVATWLNDMQNLYSLLCDLDVECMSDRDFALAILDLMPQDTSWRGFLSGLRAKVRDSDALGLPVDSTTFTTAIRDEHWYRHKDDHQNTSQIFSARVEAQKRSKAQKRSRPADIVATSTMPTPPHKRPRVRNPDSRCTNVHCRSKLSHDTADCIAYTGAKQGQYGEWWRGPWNIHLPESQRSKANNVPPKTHPAYSRWYSPTVNQTRTADNSTSTSTNTSLSRFTTAHIQSDDNIAQANSALTSGTNYYSQICDTVAHGTLPILNPTLPRDNACHHGSGVNRHVFHDRSAFEEYEPIAPLTVKGFGHNLSAVAIGQGSVRLEGRHKQTKCTILLTNVLHIPAAQTNLISGVQLDKAGVVSTLGHNSIFLSTNNEVIVSGTVVNDMYRLDVTIIIPNSIELASPPHIAPPSLALRIGPKHVGSDFYNASWDT